MRKMERGGGEEALGIRLFKESKKNKKHQELQALIQFYTYWTRTGAIKLSEDDKTGKTEKQPEQSKASPCGQF